MQTNLWRPEPSHSYHGGFSNPAAPAFAALTLAAHLSQSACGVHKGVSNALSPSGQVGKGPGMWGDGGALGGLFSPPSREEQF